MSSRSPRIRNPHLKAPRLRLPPPRSIESVERDNATGKIGRNDEVTMPPFERWGQFLSTFVWRQGQHITCIGKNGSGKSELSKEILHKRDYTLMLATKRVDPLYLELEKEGYKQVKSVAELEDVEPGKYLFKPALTSPSKDAIRAQAESFRELLLYIYQTGYWCLFADEIRYLTDNLGLRQEFDVLWLQGRSLHISVLALTQRPVSIPLLAFDQAAHLFAFRTVQKDDVVRIGEYSGVMQPEVMFALPRLAPHEVLYIDTTYDRLIRTNIRT